MKRTGGWFSDTLTLELDGDKIFSSPVGGLSAQTGIHKYRVGGTEFTFRWKWSELTGDPKYLGLGSADGVIHSYGTDSDADDQVDKKSRSTGAIVKTLVIVVLLATAFITNPTQERHKEAIRDAVYQKDPAASMLGIGRIAAWATIYHSIGVASVTVMDGQPVSFGAFGIVLVRPL